MAIKLLYVLAALALLNNAKVMTKMSNLKLCSLDDAVDTECECTLNLHPSACTCPATLSPSVGSNILVFDNALCQKSKIYDGLTECQSTTLPQGGCQCTVNFEPNGCTYNPLVDYQACTGGTFEHPTPFGCLPEACKSDTTLFPCICDVTHFPEHCTCLVVVGDAATKPTGCETSTKFCKDATTAELTTAGTTTCPCYTAGDPRSTLCASSPACDDTDADLSDVPIEICGCQGAEDSRQACICIEYHEPANCICSTESTGQYPKKDCEAQLACAPIVPLASDIVEGCEDISLTCAEVKTNNPSQFLTVESTLCPCESTADPRATTGGKCPAYCAAKDTPSDACVCDSASTAYTPAQCAKDKVPDPCATITAETPKETCECPLEKAAHESDQRKDGICKCPTDKKSQAYKADPRTKSKLACAAGSVRAAFAVVIAVSVVIPVVALFV